MGTIFVVSLVALSALEAGGGGTATQLAGGAMEGKEQRFGILGIRAVRHRRRRSRPPAR